MYIYKRIWFLLNLMLYEYVRGCVCIGDMIKEEKCDLFD